MLDFQTFLIAGVAVLLTGISKAGFGGALGGIAVPLMAIWMRPADAAAVLLPILCLMDWIGIRAFWGRWSAVDLRLLLPAALVGVAVGALAFNFLPEAWVKLCIGSIAVGFALAKLKDSHTTTPGAEIPRPRTGAALLWGGLSGFTSTLAHAGGPPVLIYLLNRRLDKETFIATTVVFFTVTNALKLVPYGVMGIFSPSSLLASLMLAPLAPLGVQLGMKLQKRIPERPFFWGATLLMGLSGLKLIFDGLA